MGSRDPDEQSLRLICSAGPGRIDCQKDVMTGRTAHRPLIRQDDRAFQARSKMEVDGSQSLITEAALKLDAEAKKLESEYSCL